MSERVSMRYITGFFDGEGTIGIGIHPTHYRFNFSPVLSISQKEGSQSSKLFSQIRHTLKNKQYHPSNCFNNGKYLGLTLCSGWIEVDRMLSIMLACGLTIKRSQAILLLRLPRRPIAITTPQGKIRAIRTMEKIDKINNLKGGCRGKYNANYFRRHWNFKLKDLKDNRNQQNNKKYLEWKPVDVGYRLKRSMPILRKYPSLLLLLLIKKRCIKNFKSYSLKENKQLKSFIKRKIIQRSGSIYKLTITGTIQLKKELIRLTKKKKSGFVYCTDCEKPESPEKCAQLCSCGGVFYDQDRLYERRVKFIENQFNDPVDIILKQEGLFD